MKKNTVSPSSKKTRIAIALVCSIVIILFAGLYLSKHSSSGSNNQSNSSQDTAYNAEQKQKVLDNSTQSNSSAANSSNKSTAGGTYTAPTSTDNISVQAERTSSDSVTVITKLKGYSDGTCTLIVTNGTKSFSQSAAVMFQPDYSTCAGFSIPVSELGTGHWSIKITVTSGGVSLSKESSYEVQ